MNKLISYNLVSFNNKKSLLKYLPTSIPTFKNQIKNYTNKSTDDLEPTERCVFINEKDTKHIICYHPENDHPFEYTKPIERKVEDGDENVLKTNILNSYKKRFDDRVPKNNKEFWFDTLRLAKTFHENPMKFKLPDRKEKVRSYMRSKVPKKRETF